MVRDFRWYTTINGHTNTDEVVQLYSGLGTVWRVTGTVTAVSSDPDSTLPLQLFAYTVNVGTATADPVLTGEDPEGTMLHGAGIGVDPTASTWQTASAPVELESEGRRIIGPGESVWMRFRPFSGEFTWTWFYGVRVLILLPE